MSCEKLSWLKQRFGDDAVREAIALVGPEKAEQFLCAGGHYPEA